MGGQTVPQSSPHGVCTAQYCTACYLINSTILLYFKVIFLKCFVIKDKEEKKLHEIDNNETYKM